MGFLISEKTTTGDVCGASVLLLFWFVMLREAKGPKEATGHSNLFILKYQREKRDVKCNFTYSESGLFPLLMSPISCLINSTVVTLVF